MKYTVEVEMVESEHSVHFHIGAIYIGWAVFNGQEWACHIHTTPLGLVPTRAAAIAAIKAELGLKEVV